jgi:hypothetical protein
MVTQQEYDEAGQRGARREAEKGANHVTADMVEDACQAIAKANGSDQYPDGKYKDYWVSRPIISAALEAVIPPPADSAGVTEAMVEVPRKPTPNMIAAMRTNDNWPSLLTEEAEAIYAAALSAARGKG